MSLLSLLGNIDSSAFGRITSSSSQNFSDEVQRLAKDFAYRYSTSATNQQTLIDITDFIERVKKKYPDIEFAPAYEDDNDEMIENGHK